MTAGNATHNTINYSAQFDLLMAIEFFFDKSAMKKMATEFETYNNTFTPLDFGRKTFEKGKKSVEILGKERGDKALSELNLYGKKADKKFPDELENLFSLVTCKWFTTVKQNPFLKRANCVADLFKNGVFIVMFRALFRNKIRRHIGYVF